MHKYTPEEFEIVFWSKVDRSNGATSCWNWAARINEWGYGEVWYKGRHCKSHRVSWELMHGEIPDGLCVLHTCDNPACVNPNHLFLGTNLDNMRDKVSKNRQSRLNGENHPLHKLTKEQVLAIRQEYSKGDVSLKTLSKRYGIGISTAGGIVTYRAWRELE